MFNFLSPDSAIGRFLSLALDVMLISLAFILCCLPIVTIGAAVTAVCKVAQNWVRKEDQCTVKDFFRAFRENFKGATIMWLVLLPCMLLVGYNGWLVLLSEVQLPKLATVCLGIGAGVLLVTVVYAFPLQATFVNPPIRNLTNALRIGISNLIPTVGILMIYAVALLLCLLFPAATGFFVVLALMFSARPVWWVFRRVMAQLGEDPVPEPKNERKNLPVQ